ncbi:MAG: 2-isopropylmalate synthase [bacterium]
MKRIKIFDTTLRDGEQSPGCSMTLREKIEIAQQLERLGVDVIEAGFAISSQGDYESIEAISKKIKKSCICSLARAIPKDIEVAYNSIKLAKHQRIHTFIATSPIHMEHKLKMSEQQVLDMAVSAVTLAKGFVEDVEFSCEDAGRSDFAFLVKVYEAVIEAGATVINVPDTVGYQSPDEYGELIANLNKQVKGIDAVDISVHCHNDLGFATANSLFGVLNGATQVECTINGIGERAGNTALEEIVMALTTRKDRLPFSHGINTNEIFKTSRLVSTITGSVVQPNKAIVGSNAFSHEAGIHQDGVLKFKETYEIMNAESIGLKANTLVLGKHSGRHAFKERLTFLGHHLEKNDLDKAFERFKQLADKKKQILDADLEVILADDIYQVPDLYTLKYVQVSAGNLTRPVAVVQLIRDEKVLEASMLGSGPVDAIYKAIDSLVGETFNLRDFAIQSVSGGTDALGVVSVQLFENQRIFSGRGSSTDVLVSAAKAYVMAINHVLHARGQKKIYAHL